MGKYGSNVQPHVSIVRLGDFAAGLDADNPKSNDFNKSLEAQLPKRAAYQAHESAAFTIETILMSSGKGNEIKKIASIK